jgi:hypothetical protein
MPASRAPRRSRDDDERARERAPKVLAIAQIRDRPATVLPSAESRSVVRHLRQRPDNPGAPPLRRPGRRRLPPGTRSSCTVVEKRWPTRGGRCRSRCCTVTPIAATWGSTTTVRRCSTGRWPVRVRPLKTWPTSPPALWNPVCVGRSNVIWCATTSTSSAPTVAPTSPRPPRGISTGSWSSPPISRRRFTVVFAERLQRDESMRPVLERAVTAVRDHDAFDRLRRLLA